MASASDHSASEGVGSSSTVVDVDAPLVSPASLAQGSSTPAPALPSVVEILQRLEGLVRRTAIIVGEGAGKYHDALPLMEAGLEAVHHVGSPQLARWCERELSRLERWMYHLKDLAQDEALGGPPLLPALVLFAREDLAKRIQAREAELQCLRKQHHAVLAKMDAYMNAAFFEDARSLEGEARLRELEREKMRVSHAAEAATKGLQLLRRKEEDGEAALARLLQRQEAKT